MHTLILESSSSVTQSRTSSAKRGSYLAYSVQVGRLPVDLLLALFVLWLEISMNFVARSDAPHVTRRHGRTYGARGTCGGGGGWTRT